MNIIVNPDGMMVGISRRGEDCNFDLSQYLQ